MLRIVKSLLTIAAVAAIATGATGAYFSDNITVPGNTFSSGNLDIVWSGTASSPIILANMEPGTWYGDQAYPGGDYKLGVFNHTTNSTMNAKYRFREGMTGGSSALYNKINVKVYRHEMVGPTHVWVQYYNGALSGMIIDPSVAPIMGNIAPGTSHEWKFAFQLDPSVDNTYHSLSTTFDLFYDATQVSNPGW